MGCDDFDVEVGDEEGYGGVFVGSADADGGGVGCCGRSVTEPVLSMRSCRTLKWVVLPVWPGFGFGEPVVDGGGG